MDPRSKISTVGAGLRPARCHRAASSPPTAKRCPIEKGFSPRIFRSRILKTVLTLTTLATTITVPTSAQSLPETVEAIDKARSHHAHPFHYCAP